MKTLFYILLIFLISCKDKPIPTNIWVQQELKNFQVQNNWYDVIEVIKLDSLDFTNGGWSIGNGFYDGKGDRLQKGNLKAWLYEYDLDLSNSGLEINTGVFLLTGKLVYYGREASLKTLKRDSVITENNNLSLFVKK